MAEDTEARRGTSVADNLIPALRMSMEHGDGQVLHALLEPLHPADVADILEQLRPAERMDLIRLWGSNLDGETLSEVDESIREDIIHMLEPKVLADAVRELDSDDVVDIIEDLEQHDQERILRALDSDDRVAVEQSLSYPADSAGRLMQREVVSAPGHWTVGEMIDHLRNQDWLPDQFYHVILVDPRMKPQGYVTLGRMLASRREVRLQDIIEDSFRTIPATEPQTEVAWLFTQYHLISLPVTDESGRLVGTITIDDALEVLSDEHEEDMLRMAGVNEESSISDGVMATIRQRLPWLLVNMTCANISAFVIGQFEGTIAAIVALAVLMPIVASMGGNAGTQSLAVAVRALATRDLTASNAGQVVRRELTVGLFNGICLAVVMGLMASFVYGQGIHLGMVIAAAIVLNLTIAGLTGVLVPLVMTRIGLDPALASGTFVTTTTDVMGFLTFLGLATWFLL